MNGRRVLVADDLRDHVEVLCKLLEMHGHTVFAAFDGWEALEIAAAHRPDVCILDIEMPGPDGYEVCRRLRAETWGQQVLIIVLTGWAARMGEGGGRRRDARQAGADHYLLKPTDLKSLLALFE